MDGPNPDFFKRDRLRRGLAPTRVAALAVAVMALGVRARAGAADNLELLGEKQIRATVTGKGITDGAHWSLYVRPDGASAGVESGARSTGPWNAQKCKLRMTNPGSKVFDCCDVWMSGENMSLRFKPDDDTFVGVVEKHKTN